MAWHLAPSLVRLRSEINKRWPRRDKASDGSIGDARHSARTSDHNPNSRRSVNAIDVDKDGIDPMFLVRQAIKHPATNYVIYNRRIYSRAYGFRSRRYTGSNPHTHHVHISVRQARDAENSSKSWGIASSTGGTTPAPKPVPNYPAYPGLLQSGSSGAAVKKLQTRLNERGYTPKLTVDGDFGPATRRNVVAFQKWAGLLQDGKCGPATWKAIWTRKIT